MDKDQALRDQLIWLENAYEERRRKLLIPLSSHLEKWFVLIVMLGADIRCNHSVRVKDVDKFLEKALLREDKHYEDPLHQIQDQIGVRFITRFDEDIEVLVNAITRSCDIIEREDRRPRHSDAPVNEVGYGTYHLIVRLPENHTVPEGITDQKWSLEAKSFAFEVQIRTYLQHAWAEAEHELNYKSAIPLPPEIQRRLNVLAGVLELADSELEAVRKARDHLLLQAFEGIKNKNYNVPLSDESLSLYAENDNIAA